MKFWGPKMLKYTVYGNCQSTSIAHSLGKSDAFSSTYDYQPIKPVHVVKAGEEDHIITAFQEMDLIIQQPIADAYKHKKLTTTSLMENRKPDSMSFFLPPLYFNAYFPHIDNLPGRETSILNSIHDYVVIFSYLNKMAPQEIVDLITSERFYTPEMSKKLYTDSLEALQKREESLEIKIADFLDENFASAKLFSTFNHPKGIVFDHVANVILELLGMEKINISSKSKTALDNLVDVPVYKSTYKNLNMTFEEDFSTYKVVGKKIPIDEVVTGLVNTYKQLDEAYLLDAVKTKKPFVMKLFKYHGISSF